MEIYRGKEGMKSAKFNDIMGAKSGCRLRLLLNTIALQQQLGCRHGI
jgi:hypothetical protein